MFVLSFVSSNNTDVKTAKQFILLCKTYLCDFSGLANFSLAETLIFRLEENSYILLCRFLGKTVTGFLSAFDPRLIIDAFH